MTFSSQQFTLGTGVATLIVPSRSNWQKLIIHNQNKSSNQFVFLGDSTVGTGNGTHIDPGETEQIDLMPGAEIWATTNHDGIICAVAKQVL